MKVFITGATGFVGLNIVKALTEANHEVHAYVRDKSNTLYLDRFDIATYKGELSDVSGLQTAMRGMDAVIHTAGNTSCYMRDFEKLYQVNVEGTKNIVDAAIRCGVKRIVYTSTTSTVGALDNSARSFDEETRLRGFRANSPYALTKCEAEKIVQSAAHHGVETIILNPAEVIGAFDHTMQWGRMVMAVYFNQVPFVPPGSGSFCAASEVGRAHERALELGKPGQRYILAGTNSLYTSFLDAVSRVTGKVFDIPKTGYFSEYLKARWQELVYPLTGRKPVVEPYRMKVFAGHYLFDSARAQRELGYQTRSLDEMLTECFNWYRENGFIPAA